MLFELINSLEKLEHESADTVVLTILCLLHFKGRLPLEAVPTVCAHRGPCQLC